MKIDEWMEAALIDDTLVANALLALKKSSAPELQWGHRKRRSRPTPVTSKKNKELSRLSPTTPLLWSGDSIESGSNDSSSARSKGLFANKSRKSATKKRSANKRSFAELKEEEILLLNERLHLEKDLAAACTTVKDLRAVSKKLKTFKFNSRLKSTHKIGETSTHSTLTKQNTCSDLASKSCFSDAPKDIGMFGRGFVLPDLNLEVSDDENVSD